MVGRPAIAAGLIDRELLLLLLFIMLLGGVVDIALVVVEAPEAVAMSNGEEVELAEVGMSVAR